MMPNGTPPAPSEIRERLRERMRVIERWSYFDHAAVAPLPEPTRQMLHEWIEDFSANGVVHWGSWRKRLEETRRLGARLIGATREEIALVRNTTEGVTLVAEGFPWREGDNVLIFEGEFPTNIYPWMHLHDRGVEWRLVPTENERIDLNRVEELCDSRTRIIAASWVGYGTGWRNDLDALAELAHRRGALLFVDAIQGLGAFPLDVGRTPVDFLAADGHKWMLGPEGAGLLYVRREHLPLLRPLGIGWNSVKQAGNYSDLRLDIKETADRYEGGSYNMGGLAALGASLQLLLDCGIEPVSECILEITALLRERLEQLGAVVTDPGERQNRSGILSFELPGRDAPQVRQQCLERGVALAARKGRLRASPHAYTTAEDIDRLISALA